MGDLTRSTVSQCDVLPPLTLSPPLPRLTFPESRFPSALTTHISSAQRLPRPHRRESLSLPKPNTPPQLSAKKTRRPPMLASSPPSRLPLVWPDTSRLNSVSQRDSSPTSSSGNFSSVLVVRGSIKR